MTPQEAIEILEINAICSPKATKFKEAVEVAKQALEKQIPKKPRKEIWVDDEKRKGDVRLATKDDVLTKDNHGTITHCPNCDEWVTVQKYLSPPKYDLFCRNCGQALDWSDT